MCKENKLNTAKSGNLKMVLTTGFIQPTYIYLYQQNYLLYVKSDYSSSI